MKRIQVTQEGVVFSLALILAVGLAIGLGKKFYDINNLVTLIRSVAILGMLGLGMGVVIIGRGIDLAMIATMVVSVSVVLVLPQASSNLPLALLIGLVFVLGIGLLSGVLIAYAEIPAIFTTLAMGLVVYGVGRSFFFRIDNLNAPQGYWWFDFLGHGSILTLPLGNGHAFELPAPIGAFAMLGLVLFFLLRWTRFGRFVYAAGDNPLAARITGTPTRLVLVAQYVISSVVAYLAGIVMAAASYGMNTRIYNSTMIYDVLLIVVLGGIGLSGGRGGIRNVLVGTLLVGVLLNGMTILDVPYTQQNLIKSIILLGALVIDSLINPRDEQTTQQGDV